MNVDMKTLFRATGAVEFTNGVLNYGVCAESKDPSYFSNKRPDAAATANSKISQAIKIFDYLYNKGISVYENEPNESVYLETDGITILASESEGKTTGISIDLLSIAGILGTVCWNLSKFSSNTEMKSAFANINKYYQKGLNNLSSEEKSDFNGLCLLFCDSFYYGYAAGQEKYPVNNTLSVEELEAAFRSDAFTKHELFDKECPDLLLKSVHMKRSEKKGRKKTNFLQEVKDGGFKVAYEWSDSQKMHIQPTSFLDTFVVSEQFESITKKVKHRLDKVLTRMDEGKEYLEVIGQDYINLLMVGKPGTGKTTLAYALSAATGLPVYTTAISHNTDETEFSGVTTIVDGKPQFCETNFLEAYKNGGIIVLEEINLAQPSVMMGGLGQAIEYPFIVKENGYKDVRRHPMCVIIGTMNVGTAGSKQLNAAFANRFHQTYTLNDPTRESLIDVLCNRSGAKKEMCTWVYDVYQSILAFLADPDTDAECDKDAAAAGLSLRTCLGALENIEEGDTPYEAVTNSLIGAIALMDLQLARELNSNIKSTVCAPPEL